MMRDLRPRWVTRNVCRLIPEWLARQGVRAVLSDLDNTLCGYHALTPSPEILAWIQSLRESGIKLMLVSNNLNPSRVAGFAQPLGLPYLARSGKPKPDSLVRAMQTLVSKPEETVMVGDQLYIDVWAGNRAGVRTVLVDPYTKGFWFSLRRLCETPFIPKTEEVR